MTYVGRVDEWRSGWAGTGRRIAGPPQAAAVAGLLLGVLAVAEWLARAASTGASAEVALLGLLLCLSTTLPLAFLRPAGAAVAVCAACVLSLASFQILTVAGLAAQLAVLYRLGRDGS